jgi:hypothetical protein
VVAGVRDGQAGLPGQRLNRFFALGEQIEQLETRWMGDRLPDSGELYEEVVPGRRELVRGIFHNLME